MSYKNDPTWDLDPKDQMTIRIWSSRNDYDLKKTPLMRISLEEAIESAGRKNVMKHVKACDETPWLLKWKADRDDELIEILKR